MNHSNGLQGSIGAQVAQAHKYAIKDEYSRRTIGQNSDLRIAGLKAEIQRLEGVREQLQSGASLLDVRIEDLRQTMNY